MSDFEKLINASELFDWIMETYPDWCVGAIRGIVDHIKKMPSAQQERKKGMWVIDRDGNWSCDQCGNAPYHCDMENMNFCPNCGAKMGAGEAAILPSAQPDAPDNWDPRYRGRNWKELGIRSGGETCGYRR